MKKKGWIRIIEAFFAILLVIIILILVVNKQDTQKKDNSPIIYNSEIFIIRSVQLNNTIRKDILNVNDATLPINSDNESFLQNVKQEIILKTPGYLTCDVQICKVDSICNYWKNINKEIYAQSTLITATLKDYNPKKLKLFCLLK